MWQYHYTTPCLGLQPHTQKQGVIFYAKKEVVSSHMGRTKPTLEIGCPPSVGADFFSIRSLQGPLRL